MKPLPKEGDWVTCISRTKQWVLESDAQIGKNYQIQFISYTSSASSIRCSFLCSDISWNDGGGNPWVELEDFRWETEFEKMVREATEL